MAPDSDLRSLAPYVRTQLALDPTAPGAAALRQTPRQLGDLSAGAIAERRSICRKKRMKELWTRSGGTWKDLRLLKPTKPWTSEWPSSRDLESRRPSASWHAPGPQSLNRTDIKIEFCASGESL